MEERKGNALDSDTQDLPEPKDNDMIDAEEAEELALMERFLNDPAHDYRNLKYGDTVDGTIMRIDKDEILVDIGAKAEGIVPSREMQSLPAED
ncbi:MAG: S1 RNA-binding domain-containing protein, partial [Chloroflexales bacterium]